MREPRAQCNLAGAFEVRRIGRAFILRGQIKEYSREKRDEEATWKGLRVASFQGDDDRPAIAEQGGGDSPEGLLSLSAKMDKIFAS